MRILISNDDGYQAPGLECLAEHLEQLAEVFVVAPDRNRSGASNSLTLHRPICPRVAKNGYTYVDGTPTDCVHLAITGLMDPEPDIVVSGINAGGNLGDDVIYSGTVAAAMEGRHLGLPAIAVSLVGDEGNHYLTAAKVVERMLAVMPHSPLPPNSILNINVPDCDIHDLRGFRVTRLGYRHKAEPVVRGNDPHGRPVYWVGPPGEEQDAGEGTDFHAVKHNYVSVTPLQIDLTRHDHLPVATSWLSKIEF